MRLNTTTYKPIFSLLRDDINEVQVFGTYGLKIGQELLTPSNYQYCFLSRSLLKPWQLAVCMPYLNDNENWALGMSSSSGERIHTDAINQLLNITGISTEELICPESFSYHEKTRARQISSETPMDKKFHFCCGKHITMKYASQKMVGSENQYFSQNTPLHKNLSQTVSEYTSECIDWGIDSCGLPTLIAPMKSYLDMWGKLSKTNDKNMEKVKYLWTKQPELIGGTSRVDSDIMQLSNCRILAKEGADGLLAIHFLNPCIEKNVTLIIKLSQSVPDQYLIYALHCILAHHIKKIPSHFIDALEQIVNKDILFKGLSSNLKIINLLT